MNRKTTRRQAIIELGTGLLSLGLMGRSSPAAATGERPRPNILFILSDDHRWDALSHLGHSVLSTPSLDRLAREGVLFENAFCTTSLCSPSRASFLTGMYAHNHGVKNNMTPWNNSHLTLLPALAVAIMVLMSVFTNFDGGVTYFFLYNDFYRWLFLG